MKVKDMEKLVERAGLALEADEVAVASGTREWEAQWAQRARVLGVRQARKVYSGQRWDWGGHKANDGVRVCYLDAGSDPEREPAGREKVVGPRQVLGLWSEHQSAQKAAAERNAAEQERRQNRKQRAEDAARRLGGSAHAEYNAFTRMPDGRYTVKLTIEQAEDLVKLLDAAEWKHGVSS